jgi:hypothetical protein
MPASSAISLVRTAATPFWVNSLRAACLIFSSVLVGVTTVSVMGFFAACTAKLTGLLGIKQII